ncbi:NAD-dependent epimerase/dehydratase family protein [Halomicrobium mukohataei]|uniref:NAD-dependent epimerase/dehydratase family protein n=1 Tax=Halomicrobium mukohataei TaxID=57705 RepID=A0A847UGI6_9EURY|nr:GDP-mannose 4,6-dehydratase [Halomicrobium mukohataei]NLV11596.1 NAD-dependent epimerase/dehydratase family protein [Halomicrobium mukohataei]
MSRVVVTGAAGFIGRWVVLELLDRGYHVVGLDNFSNGRQRNVGAFRDVDAFEMCEGDICDLSVVADLINKETDACIHLAAEIDVHESLNSPDTHFQTNVVGTQNVLEACRLTETRLGLVGTCMVYDMAESESGIDEAHPVKPASPYAGTKLAAENIAESYHRSYDLPVTILRPFNTYGPYQEGGVVPIFVERDIRGETLQIYGDGTQTRDLLYATDCARFVVEATFDDAAVGEVLNAGTGNDVSINELAELIASEGTDIEHVEHHHPQSEVPKLVCDPSKAGEILGWEPEYDLKTGIEQLRTWLVDRDKDA